MSYKTLGDYIQPVNNRNRPLVTEDLRGLSMTKKFRKSTSNIIGVDLTKYKLVNKNQFACDFMSVIRVHKLPVVLNSENEPVIVSPAYTVFKVNDETELLPEYLMMWFRRPEFDRYADFRCDSAVRGGFMWNELCDTQLPIPSIEKQQQIVAEYNTVTNRINLNNQLNQKLEETAQALYKHWFVDFEFPYDFAQGKPNAENKPYKSSGGVMVYNEELEKDIPIGWSVERLSKYLDSNTENYSLSDNYEIINYFDTSSVTNNVFEKPVSLNIEFDVIPSRAKRKVKENDLVYSTIRPNLKHFGLIKSPLKNTLVSTGFTVLSNKNKIFGNEFFLLFLSSEVVLSYLQSKAEMSVSTYPSIKPEDLLNLKISEPKKLKIVESLNVFLHSIYCSNNTRNEENQILQEVQSLLLAKMTQQETKLQAV
jgi:type I restriction enzyme S subunit